MITKSPPMPEITNLLKKASISLILDRYEAIFSDFDPRPFNERALSDDFLLEAQKVVRETQEGSFELHFLIPRHLHNPHEDGIIKERLHSHFKQSEHQLSSHARKTAKKGMILTAIGFVCMLFASLASLMVQQNNWYSLLVVFLEPSGWFMVWYGLDIVFYISKEKKAELEFYRKMTRADIHFDTY
jgi:hypothetical protein